MEELIAILSLNNVPTGVELGTSSETVIRIRDDDGECVCVGGMTLTFSFLKKKSVSNGIM